MNGTLTDDGTSERMATEVGEALRGRATNWGSPRMEEPEPEPQFRAGPPWACHCWHHRVEGLRLHLLEGCQPAVPVEDVRGAGHPGALHPLPDLQPLGGGQVGVADAV
jgi:hypothetical protein